MTVNGSVVKKLKIKITNKGVGTSQENGVKPQNQLDDKKSVTGLKIKLPVPANSRKRGPEITLDGEKDKWRKMDRSVKQQCGSILHMLMTHKLGWPFLTPVDPLALNIPDYFDIITKPMDLGTIKSKLNENLYFSVAEFAADVRLTFSNCMTYNPPYNQFHAMAKELDGVFNKRWKVLETKWKCNSVSADQGCLPNSRGKVSQDSDRAYHAVVTKADPEIKSSSMESQLVSDTNGDETLRAELQKESGSPSSDHSSCATTSTSNEGCTSMMDAQLSPSKALRAAILYSRFSETIFKANHKDDKADPQKLQQEKERLLKKQLAEKARIEEQIKAAEAASRMKAEAERKAQREREREASRIALEKMEQTVELENNLEILKDLEEIIQSTCADDLLLCGIEVKFSLARNPLESLGLYIKKEFLDEEDEAFLDVEGEDGEIIN